MPKAKKSRLKLGKRCRFYKRHPWAIGHGWFNTEDEVFNKVNYSASIKKPYQPKSPGCGIKTFSQHHTRSTPQKLSAKGVKRISSKSTPQNSKTERTPTKSPFMKKTSRSLYADTEIFDDDLNSLEQFEEESYDNNVGNTDTVNTDNPLVDEMVKLVPSVIVNTNL